VDKQSDRGRRRVGYGAGMRSQVQGIGRAEAVSVEFDVSEVNRYFNKLSDENKAVIVSEMVCLLREQQSGINGLPGSNEMKKLSYIFISLSKERRELVMEMAHRELRRQERSEIVDLHEWRR
jgi:hypothetical protein